MATCKACEARYDMTEDSSPHFCCVCNPGPLRVALAAERAKVERLEAEVKRLGLEMNTEYWYAVRDENTKLRAEVKRLRAVVEKLLSAIRLVEHRNKTEYASMGYASRVPARHTVDEGEWQCLMEAAAAARAKGGSDGE